MNSTANQLNIGYVIILKSSPKGVRKENSTANKLNLYLAYKNQKPNHKKKTLKVT